MEPPFELKVNWDEEPLISNSSRRKLDGFEDHDEDADDGEAVKVNERQFSWLEYFSFFNIGLSMMWTWSMILQAVPYFQQRFRKDAWVLQYFQAFYLLFFAVTMLATTVVLSLKPGQPRYTERLRIALVVYVSVAALLMISTIGKLDVQPEVYFPFTLVMVVATAIANGLSQNAAFAFAAGFGRTEYAPALMTGEALAGLLPSTIEIVSALAFPSSYFDTNTADSHETSFLTLGYFLSAVMVGLSSMCALRFLRGRNRLRAQYQLYNSVHATRNSIPSSWSKMREKLGWPAAANFLCLSISSVSPVFISRITSVVPEGEAFILFRTQAFIPLAIVLWNMGDLFGSVLAVSSSFFIQRPRWLVILSLLRLVFIPLYLKCNIDGRGSDYNDWFYLIGVQFLFGLTHGWLSGASMMGVPAWVAEKDREEAGAFMGMTLVTGLFAGSILGLAAARM